MANSAERRDRADPLPERREEDGGERGGDAEQRRCRRQVGRDQHVAGSVRARRLDSIGHRPSPHAERRAEPLGEHVVGELGDRTRARRGGHRRPPAGSSSRASNASATASDPRAIDDEAGHAVGDRLGRAARRRRRPAARRTPRPRRTRCRSPPARGRPTGCGTASRTRRRTRTARAGRRWATRPRNRTGASRSAASRRSRRSSRPPPAMASTRSGRRGRQQGDGLDRRVEALARHEPGDRHDQLAVGGQAELAPGGDAARRRPSGRKRSTSTPGGTIGDGQLAPGRALGLGGRVPAGGDDVAGAAQHVAERLLAPRQPARHGDLGAVQHDVVRQLQRRPDQPERHRRVEHDELGADLAGEVVDAPHHQRVRQQHRLARPLDAERLLRRRTRRPRGRGW